MSKSKGKTIEILITHISYDSKKMDDVIKKYFNGNSHLRDILVKKRLYLANFGMKFGSFFDGFTRLFNKKGIHEIFQYLKKCQLKEVKGMNLDLELTMELKNIDISKLINEYVLPKTENNIFVYELLKLLNDDLDNETKTNCIKLILDILNEKRIIPQYIDKISDNIEALSGLNLKVGDIKMKVKN